MSKRLIAAFVLLLISGFARNVLACSCFEGGPPCQQFGTTDAVFLGRVTRITHFEVDVDGGFPGERHTYLRVRFQVQAAFRGVEGREVEVVTSASGSSCGYGFERNETYVVYADRSQSDGLLFTGLCSGTKRAAAAKADLDYFRERATLPPGGRVFGAIEQVEKDPLRFDEKSLGPALRVPVLVRNGDNSWKTVTDNRGRYEVSGLPPGAYEIQPLLQPGFSAGGRSPLSLKVEDRITLKVEDRGCARADFVVLASRRIQGRLLDAQGQRVADQSVDLLPESKSSLDRNLYVFPSVISAADGSFEFEYLPAGRYYVGVNLKSPPYTFTPTTRIYPRTFYPGVVERSAAVAVDVTDGSREAVDIRLPSPLVPREIRGIVRWSDGRPAAGASVSLSNPTYASSQSVATQQADENGQFVLEGYQGTPFVIIANVYRTAESPVAAESKPVAVENSFTEIMLRFPGRVAGRVVDARGLPAADIGLELISPDSQLWTDEFPRAPRRLSGRDGRYVFEDVPPGRYFVATHFTSPPGTLESGAAYPSFFYPAAVDRRDATVVYVEEGRTVELADLTLPSPLIAQKLEGSIVWGDGSPVRSGAFYIEDSEYPGWSYVAQDSADANGRFSVSLLRGRRYVIYANTRTTENGDTLPASRESPRIEVLVKDQTGPIKLTLPFFSGGDGRF
jgi:hypothetical protein